MHSIQLPGKRPTKDSSQIQCPTPTPNLNSWVSPPLSSPVFWVRPLENGRGHFPFWPSAPTFTTGTSLITQISGRGSEDALIGSQDFQGISFPLPTLSFLGLVLGFSVDPAILEPVAWSFQRTQAEAPLPFHSSPKAQDSFRSAHKFRPSKPWPTGRSRCKN